MVKNTHANTGGMRVKGLIPGLGSSPGEDMATRSSILTWRVQWTEEPGRLQSMGRKESK